MNIKKLTIFDRTQDSLMNLMLTIGYNSKHIYEMNILKKRRERNMRLAICRPIKYFISLSNSKYITKGVVVVVYDKILSAFYCPIQVNITIAYAYIAKKSEKSQRYILDQVQS